MLRCSLALVVVAALLWGQPARKAGAHKLIVISVAGLDARFLAEPVSRLKIPNIRKLMRTGTAAAGVIGVAPSDTRASAISMVTGLPPADDGAAATLWQAAAGKGIKTAAVYWPGTAGVQIDFDLPATNDQVDGSIPFAEVTRRAAPAGIVDRIEKSSPGFQKELWDDSSATTAAIYCLRVEKPELLLVELTDLDFEQRETRAFTVYARQTLEDDDEHIGQILAAAGPDTVVALVSGHGFENEDYVVRPRVLVKGPVDVRDGLIGTTDRAVADQLRQLLKDGRRHGLAREVPISEVKSKAPEISGWVAAFDTPPGCVASAQNHGPALGPGTHLAVSGLWPTRPGYRSVFVMSGPGIPARHIGEMDLLQIAPTLADVIGVELPQANGKSIWPIE